MNIDPETKERIEKSKSLLRKLREERIISKVKESVNPEKELHEIYKSKIKEILHSYTRNLQSALRKSYKDYMLLDGHIVNKIIDEFVEDICGL